MKANLIPILQGIVLKSNAGIELTNCAAEVLYRWGITEGLPASFLVLQKTVCSTKQNQNLLVIAKSGAKRVRAIVPYNKSK